MDARHKNFGKARITLGPEGTAFSLAIPSQVLKPRQELDNSFSDASQHEYIVVHCTLVVYGHVDCFV